MARRGSPEDSLPDGYVVKSTHLIDGLIPVVSTNETLVLSNGNRMVYLMLSLNVRSTCGPAAVPGAMEACFPASLYIMLSDMLYRRSIGTGWLQDQWWTLLRSPTSESTSFNMVLYQHGFREIHHIH